MSEELLPRDLAMLRHVGLYRVGLYPVLSHLFFGGSGPACGIAIKRLVEARGKRRELIQLHSRALPGKLSYATLRPTGCSEVGVSAKRANPLGTAALNLAIGVSYFCGRGEHRRHRIERAELRRFFNDATPPENVLHVATDELGWPAVLRVYQIGPNVTAIVRAIRKDLAQLGKHPEIGSWITAGDYGVAILVPWPDKLARVRETVSRSGLMDEVAIVIGTGPTAETLHAALKFES